MNLPDAILEGKRRDMAVRRGQWTNVLCHGLDNVLRWCLPVDPAKPEQVGRHGAVYCLSMADLEAKDWGVFETHRFHGEKVDVGRCHRCGVEFCYTAGHVCSMAALETAEQSIEAPSRCVLTGVHLSAAECAALTDELARLRRACKESR